MYNRYIRDDYGRYERVPQYDTPPVSSRGSRTARSRHSSLGSIVTSTKQHTRLVTMGG